MSSGADERPPHPAASVRPWVERDRDPGLQPERTRMAWRRTTLSCAVTVLLAIRQVLHTDGGPLRVSAVSLLALAFVAFLWLAHLRTQRLAASRPPMLAPWAAVSAVGCTIAFAVFGAALLF